VSTGMEIPQDPEFHMGGGDLYSTVGDHLKFTQMILHGGTFNGAEMLRPANGRPHVAKRHGRPGVQSDEDGCSFGHQRR
jgi:hypothetical protein